MLIKFFHFLVQIMTLLNDLFSSNLLLYRIICFMQCIQMYVLYDLRHVQQLNGRK